MVPLTAASSLPTRALEKICSLLGGGLHGREQHLVQNQAQTEHVRLRLTRLRRRHLRRHVVLPRGSAVRLRVAAQLLRRAYIRVPAAMTDASSLKEREVVSGAAVEAEAGSSAEEASFMAK